MLSHADNAPLCRVGPGTPMGTLMREYRLAVLYDGELPPDAAPPPGAAEPNDHTVRTCRTVPPAEANWPEALSDWHTARTKEHPNRGCMGRRRILAQAVGGEYARDSRGQH
jgi:hypothetical protein